MSPTGSDSSLSSTCSDELECEESDNEINCNVPGSFASCIGRDSESMGSDCRIQSMSPPTSGSLSVVLEEEENPSECEESINPLQSIRDDDILLKQSTEMMITDNLSIDTADTSYTKSLSFQSLESNSRDINCFEDKNDAEHELASRLEVICSLKEIILSQRKAIKKLKKEKQRLKIKLEKTK